jgi:hypothetical protein
MEKNLFISLLCAKFKKSFSNQKLILHRNHIRHNSDVGNIFPAAASGVFSIIIKSCLCFFPFRLAQCGAHLASSLKHLLYVTAFAQIELGAFFSPGYRPQNIRENTNRLNINEH